MENTTISGPEPYAYSHGQFDAQLVACTAPGTLDHLEASKRLPSTLPPPPPYTHSHRWRAADPMDSHSATRAACQHSQLEYDRLARREFAPQPYIRFSRPPSPDVDDVPLGYFFSTHAFWEQDDDDTSCADEAPPSYAVAVGHGDRETLLQHFFRVHGGYGEVDEESGVGLDMAWEMQRREDEPYAVLKIVAMFAVAIILFGVSGALGWMALSGILQ